MAKKGFTLIELIIYISLAVIILNISIYFIWQMMDSKSRIVAYGEIENNLNFVLDKVSLEAKKAKSLVTPSGSGKESQELLLMMPNGQSVRFYLDQGKVILERNTTKLAITSSRVKVSELTFQNLSAVLPSTFQLRLKVNYGTDDLRMKNIELSGEETINLRDN
jgi:Tfp pilus assembly protein FimT